MPQSEPPRTGQAAQSSPKKKQASGENELNKRLAAAQVARSAGDALKAAQANKQVISLALKELGRLRLLQQAYPQSIEIYRRSLDFSEEPETRVDLAIAELGANRMDDALSDADRVLRVTPNDARALTVRGRAWMAKREVRKGVEDLSRAVQIAPDVETFYQLAIYLLSSPDADDKRHASDVFEQMVRLAGDSGSLHVLFGRAYRDANGMPGAIREFQRAIALDTRTPHAHYFLGLAHLAVNEWKPTPEIRAELSKELEYHPKDYLANYMLGFLASSDREYETSDRYLKVAAAVQPGWPEPWLYMGLNAYAQEDMKNAEVYLRKAVVLTGDDESRSNYQIRRAYVDLGRILSNSGRTEEAETFLAKARDLQKKTMELTQQQIASVIAEGGGTMAAVVPLKSESEVLRPSAANVDPFARVDASALAAANLSPQQRSALDAEEKRLRSILALAFNDLATAEAVNGQFLAALGHYQESERWDASTPGLQKNMGLSAFRSGNYPETIRAMSRALEQDPGDAPVRAILGSAYYASDDYANAAKTFAPLGERGIRDQAIGFIWADSLFRVGDSKRAAQVLQEFEQIQLKPESLLLVGKLWTDIGDYARAVDIFHRALAMNSSLPKAHLFAGTAFLRWARLSDAIAEFNAELKLVPTDSEAKNSIGYVYLQQARPDEAKAIFQSVIENDPGNGNAQYQLGKLLLDEGQTREAISHLEVAVRFMPDADYVHYQLQAAYRKDSRVEDADRELELYKQLKSRNRQASIPRPVPETTP